MGFEPGWRMRVYMGANAYGLQPPNLWWVRGSEMSGCQIRLMNEAHNNDYRMRFKFGGTYKSFRKNVPANLEKMKSAFYGKHAAGEMSFALGMVASPSNQTQQSKGKAIDMEKHKGDSDETNEDGSDADIECLGVEEIRSPPRIVHSSCKRKSEGGTSSDDKRQELLNWSSRDEEVHQALAILRMREESRMDEEDCTMDEENCTMDEEEGHAIDTIVIYILERFQVERPHSMLKERLPRAIGGESGANYIHRLLYGNRPDLCCTVLRLDKDDWHIGKVTGTGSD
ncbi:hypothetical protein Cgig2_023630 [Carnegiea gigantea]|uniref:Uncharacterized protein n=1 Tax=Carnegiea gigantea TaxID=171969 RepID=A0A9Q1KEI5_9CARY|nr:hypothetical protein Cgig2_023630 [Carnegiea gigantea]